MLDLDRAIAKKRGLNIRAVRGSMEHLSAFTQGSFELVLQPVSTCYIPTVQKLFLEVARVLSPGGLYISQHKQPASLQAEVHSSPAGCLVSIPYLHEGPLPAIAAEAMHREKDTVEYLHRWEELLGGMCRAGFVIEDVSEPGPGNPLAPPGSFEHRSAYLPPYIKIKARRNQSSSRPNLWIP